MKTAYELMLDNPAVLGPLMGGMSRWEEDEIAEAIITGLGESSSPGYWDAVAPRATATKSGVARQQFYDFTLSMANTFAPILSQYAGTQAIQNAGSNEKVSALQAVLAAGALKRQGSASGMNASTLSSLTAAVNSFPEGQREQYLEIAYAQLMAQTTDPTMRAALKSEYESLKRQYQKWYVTWKWPMIAGGITLGVVAMVFVAKKKSFRMSPSGSISVRA